MLREMPSPWSAYLWLAVFVATGWGLGMTYEFLYLYAGPASDRTFFLYALGYPSGRERPGECDSECE